MKKLLIALALLVFSPLLHAQQFTLTATTTSAAQGYNTNIIQLTSLTNVTYGPNATQQTILFVDGEQENVLNITGTAVTVSRGQNGTRANAHNSGAQVLLGRPNLFYSFDPAGSCTSTTIYVTPWLNTKNGLQWLCSSVSSMWVPGFSNTSRPAGVTASVASVAGTTIPSGPLFHVSGTNAITAWGVPVGAVAAPFCVIPTAAYTTTATNNIAVATTGVVNKEQCWTWDASVSKYVPSY